MSISMALQAWKFAKSHNKPAKTTNQENVNAH